MNESVPRRAEVLTPSGAGAIAVIRVRGKDADVLLDGMFRPAAPPALCKTAAGRLRYGVLYHNDETIDDVLACVVSRNANDTEIDLCLHGGVRIIERALEALIAHGVEVLSGVKCGADQGERESQYRHEFSREVWPTCNLIEREVDETLIRASTRRAVAFLATQRRLLPQRIREILVESERNSECAREMLRELEVNFASARRLIDGATVVIVGRPNSGKSTLFNRLAGRAVAVESPIEGTTRDWVAADIELDGVPVTLVDTAGWHDTPDGLERLAIESGRLKRESADVVVVVEDLTRLSIDRAANVSSLTQSHVLRLPATVIVGGNKSDLVEDDSINPAAGACLAEGILRRLRISARTGQGVDQMVAAIKFALRTDLPPDNVPSLFTRRQWSKASQVASLPITNGGAMLEALWPLLGENEETGKSGAYDDLGVSDNS